jgi:hypothetical protein
LVIVWFFWFSSVFFFDSFSVWARNKNMLESRTFLNDSSQHPVCPRCTRQHSGGPTTCKSLERTCRLCGLVGHFVEVHQVTDLKFRKEIVAALGFDIYSTNPVAGCEPDPSAASSQQQVDPNFAVASQQSFPIVAQPLSNNVDQVDGASWPSSGLNDWYNN